MPGIPEFDLQLHHCVTMKIPFMYMTLNHPVH